MDACNILIAHENPMFRRSLKRVVGRVPGNRAIGDVESLWEIEEVLEKEEVHIVLMGIGRYDDDAANILRTLKETHQETRFIVMAEDAGQMEALFSAGAMGYLLHRDMDIEILSAVATVLTGNRYVSSLIEPA